LSLLDVLNFTNLRTNEPVHIHSLFGPMLFVGGKVNIRPIQ